MTGQLLAGNTRALARCISLAESETSQGREILKTIYPRSGAALVLGITGPPGAGKSTLVSALVRAWRSRGEKVGIVAVDPTSAFSGGAILGDRIRMQEHFLDAGVFIRSMATRGHFGGVPPATRDVVDLMDAAGYGIVLVETVGVGQDEIEVVRIADLVLVVLPPGLGDDIQAIKAGILEIADVYVLNKSDRDGVGRLENELRTMLAMSSDPGGTEIPIVRTVATTGKGIPELMEVVGVRGGKPTGSKTRTGREWERSRDRFLDLLRGELLRRVRETCLDTGELDEIVKDLAARRRDPYSALEEILKRIRFPQARIRSPRGKGAR